MSWTFFAPFWRHPGRIFAPSVPILAPSWPSWHFVATLWAPGGSWRYPCPIFAPYGPIFALSWRFLAFCRYNVGPSRLQEPGRRKTGVLLKHAQIEKEIKTRKSKCMPTLTKLNKFWLHSNCPTSLKIIVQDVVMRSKLLYGLESVELQQFQQEWGRAQKQVEFRNG